MNVADRVVPELLMLPPLISRPVAGLVSRSHPGTRRFVFVATPVRITFPLESVTPPITLQLVRIGSEDASRVRNVGHADPTR
jgi:hypothetical protein